MFTYPNALQIRVSVDGVEPAIWRRLILPLEWNLGQLHLVIQAAFNWWNYHLYEFRIGGLSYGDPEMLEDGRAADGPRSFDQQEVRLRDFREPGIVFTYVYDFGDNWHHTIEIEKFLPLDEPPRQAVCIAGARARPPEDVGGTSGYEEFLEIMADPQHPEYAATKRWCGGHFDPEWFDLKLTDKDVRAALKPNVRRRQHQPKPKAAKPEA